ncbi:MULTISPECIES: DUF6303 family protein [unclassified Streptomyces]|uniref:DUF6303 family protein n=1 Tax=unclassified Streptomyces TaxID=2593676 RepID=UPI0022541FCC|nr:DUF6303 family protein [Streptomyces sp. NBC_01214]MCX4802515.1 DUF6303 family protein [Streptomyces sp. NBC_01214]
MTHSARISKTCRGEWEIYIVTDSPLPGDWPEFSFDRVSSVPTLGERTAALAVLGYEVVDGARWEWLELGDDETGPVRFLGMLDVRRVRSGDDR